MNSSSLYKHPLAYKFLGTIPYSISDDGNLRFLLGREHPEKGWSDQLKWATFGGKPEISDPSVYHGAARETYEESMGFLGSHQEILDTIFNRIPYQSYEALVFPMEINYNPELPKLFSDVYKYASNCMKLNNKNYANISSCPEGFYEKVEIGWFTVNDIIRYRNSMRPDFYNFFAHVIMQDPQINKFYSK